MLAELYCQKDRVLLIGVVFVWLATFYRLDWINTGLYILSIGLIIQIKKKKKTID